MKELMLLLLKQILYFALMKMYYAIGAVTAVLIIIIVFRMVISRKKDVYDFDSLSKQIPEPVKTLVPEQRSEVLLSSEPAETNRNFDAFDKIGKSLGIYNFREITAKLEELLRDRKKEEAVEYLSTNTQFKGENAEKLIRLFESRFNQN